VLCWGSYTATGQHCSPGDAFASWKVMLLAGADGAAGWEKGSSEHERGAESKKWSQLQQTKS